MTEIAYPPLLKACLDHPYSDAVCFLCATPLNEKNRTDEHVIPKWMQQRYDLWDQRIVLLNATPLPYRQLTVPCCLECNGRLAELEKRIKDAVDEGVSALCELSQFDLFQWLAKIFLGIGYRELFLRVDRAQPQEGSIGDPEEMKEFSLLHFWLQASMKHGASEFTPGSIFIVPTICTEDPRANFDLLDNWDSGVLGIRMDSVGVVIQFLDNGVHRWAMNDITREFAEHKHDRFQFREFAAKVVYKASLLDCDSVAKFTALPSGEIKAEVMWEAPAKGNSLFQFWEPEVFARVLAFYTGLPFAQLFEPPDRVRTWCPWDVDGMVE